MTIAAAVNDIDVVISHPGPADVLERLIASTQRIVAHFKLPATLFLTDDGTRPDAVQIASARGVKVIPQRERGYGGVLNAAVAATTGAFIVTLDGDGLHPPELLPYLYAQRESAAITIASRYVPQGFTQMPAWRGVCSRLLNSVFRGMLDLPFRDLSSSYRIYERGPLAALTPAVAGDAALQEILIKSFCQGHSVVEMPMHYVAGSHGRGRTFGTLLRLGLDYATTFRSMWVLRNSVESSDYDTRAFYSRIPFQRWWQRRRYAILSGYVGDALRVLDAGCGSTQLLNRCPQIVGMDFGLRKVRFMRRPGRRLVNGSTFALPFRSQAFEIVISSQVIEHLPDDPVIFSELIRCVAPGGALVLGTVDYGGWQWPFIERLYGLFKPTGYAQEHITHYTTASLVQRLTSLGLRIEQIQYICRGEIVIKARKPGGSGT
jgi:SAM-dependent methyltransferase